MNYLFYKINSKIGMLLLVGFILSYNISFFAQIFKNYLLDTIQKFDEGFSKVLKGNGYVYKF